MFAYSPSLFRLRRSAIPSVSLYCRISLFPRSVRLDLLNILALLALQLNDDSDQVCHLHPTNLQSRPYSTRQLRKTMQEK